MKNWFLLGLGGLISGFLSSIFSAYLYFDNFDIWPGIFFGILFLLACKKIYNIQISLPKQIFFLVFSILSYVAAFWAAFYTAGSISSTNISSIGITGQDFNIGIFVGGLVGALIFSIIAKLFFKAFKLPQIIFLVVCSGFFGILGAFLNNSYSLMIESEGILSPFLGIFVVWQFCMILLINYYLKLNFYNNKF